MCVCRVSVIGWYVRSVCVCVRGSRVSARIHFLKNGLKPQINPFNSPRAPPHTHSQKPTAKINSQWHSWEPTMHYNDSRGGQRGLNNEMNTVWKGWKEKTNKEVNSNFRRLKKKFLWKDFKIKVRGSCNPSLPVQCSGLLVSDDINHLTLLKETRKKWFHKL